MPYDILLILAMAITYSLLIQNLNQWWRAVIWNHGKKLQWKFNQNTNLFNQENILKAIFIVFAIGFLLDSIKLMFKAVLSTKLMFRAVLS